MYRNLGKIIKSVALCYVLLFAHFSYAEDDVVKTGGTTSLMLRVHYENILILQGLRQKVRNLLNKERFLGERMFGYLYLRDIEDGGVSFTAFLPEQHTAIKNLIEKNFPDIKVHQQGDEFTLKFDKSLAKQASDKVMPEIMEILYRRLQGFGVRKPILSRIGVSHILVEVPGENEQYVEVFKQLVTRSARLNFLLEDGEMSPQEALVRRPHPGSAIFYHYRSGQKIPYLLDVRPIITDRDVKKVEAGHDGREPFVLALLHPTAAKRLEQATYNNIGKRMAILFEDRVYMAPTIMETIRSGQVKITNHFSPAEAAGFAVLLASGSYPVPVEVVDERIEEIEGDSSTCCEKQLEPFVPESEKVEQTKKPAAQEVKTKTLPVEKAEPQKEVLPVIKKEEIEWEETPAIEEIIEPEPEKVIEEPVKEVTPIEEVEEVIQPDLIKEMEQESFPAIKKEEIEWEETPAIEEIIEPEPEKVIEEPVKEITPIEEVEEVIQPEGLVKEIEQESFPEIKKEEILWDEAEEGDVIPIYQDPKLEEFPDIEVLIPDVSEIPSLETPMQEQEILMEEVPYVDGIAPKVFDKVKEEPEVIEELSKFEQYLRDTNFKIEDVTSTPRKRQIPKAILELKIGDGL
jgi:protein-export membrane protein SecD